VFVALAKTLAFGTTATTNNTTTPRYNDLSIDDLLRHCMNGW
jgi:hypothetical protein